MLPISSGMTTRDWRINGLKIKLELSYSLLNSSLRSVDITARTPKISDRRVNFRLARIDDCELVYRVLADELQAAEIDSSFFGKSV